MPIARNARHAVIEGTRDQRSHFRCGSVDVGYFGSGHDVRSQATTWLNNVTSESVSTDIVKL